MSDTPDDFEALMDDLAAEGAEMDEAGPEPGELGGIIEGGGVTADLDDAVTTPDFRPVILRVSATRDQLETLMDLDQLPEAAHDHSEHLVGELSEIKGELVETHRQEEVRLGRLLKMTGHSQATLTQAVQMLLLYGG